MEEATDLRCRGKRHGILLPDGTLEVKCDSRVCKEGRAGVVILHRYDIKTGLLLETKRFTDPLVIERR